MYALNHSFPGSAQRTQAALGAPCPRRPWDIARLGTLDALAERRVR